MGKFLQQSLNISIIQGEYICGNCTVNRTFYEKNSLNDMCGVVAISTAQSSEVAGLKPSPGVASALAGIGFIYFCYLRKIFSWRAFSVSFL